MHSHFMGFNDVVSWFIISYDVKRTSNLMLSNFLVVTVFLEIEYFVSHWRRFFSEVKVTDMFIVVNLASCFVCRRVMIRFSKKEDRKMDKIIINDNKNLLTFACEDLEALITILRTIEDKKDEANEREMLSVAILTLNQIINNIKVATNAIGMELHNEI